MPMDLLISDLCDGSLDEAFNIPREIGCYSVDVQKNVSCDRSQMKYLLSMESKNLHMDLNMGYEDTIRENYDRLCCFYQYLKVVADNYLDVADSVDFVTGRGTIQMLLGTPYLRGQFNHWSICACRVDDVIYLTRIDSDEEIQAKVDATEEHKRMCAWGFRFEAYMTADRPRGVPDYASITHEVEKYNTIFTNRIGSHSLLMSAEVDGVHPTKSSRLRKGDPSCYVELKTTRLDAYFRSSFPFKKYKSLQWWAQSVVPGIEETVCGMRDDEGIVRAILTFKTKELPFSCQNFWNSSVCFNFCNNFLKYLKKIMKNNPRIVYKFDHVGQSRIFITKLRDPEERFQVIPDWYLAKLQKHEGRKKI